MDSVQVFKTLKSLQGIPKRCTARQDPSNAHEGTLTVSKMAESAAVKPDGCGAASAPSRCHNANAERTLGSVPESA